MKVREKHRDGVQPGWIHQTSTHRKTSYGFAQNITQHLREREKENNDNTFEK